VRAAQRYLGNQPLLGAGHCPRSVPDYVWDK